MQTYLDQLTSLANRRRVDLRKAVLHSGISSAQWYRWINKRTTMREATARKVRMAIEALADAKRSARRSIRASH